MSARAAGAGLRPPHPIPSPPRGGAGERRRRCRGKVPGGGGRGGLARVVPVAGLGSRGRGRRGCGLRGAAVQLRGPPASGRPGCGAERLVLPAPRSRCRCGRMLGRGRAHCTTAARGRSPCSPRALPGKFLELLKMESGINTAPIPPPPGEDAGVGSSPWRPALPAALRGLARRSRGWPYSAGGGAVRARCGRGCTARDGRTHDPESSSGEKGVPRLSGCVFLVSVGFWGDF